MQQTDLRLRNIGAQRLPSIMVDGQAQYQSDVAHLSPAPPVIGGLFKPPKDTYDSGIRVDQRLFDPTVSAQGALERAQLAENQARVRSTLFTLRQQVNDAFFAAAALQARAGSLAATIADLECEARGNQRARARRNGARRPMPPRSKRRSFSGSRTPTICRRAAERRSTGSGRSPVKRSATTTR